MRRHFAVLFLVSCFIFVFCHFLVLAVAPARCEWQLFQPKPYWTTLKVCVLTAFYFILCYFILFCCYSLCLCVSTWFSDLIHVTFFISLGTDAHPSHWLMNFQSIVLYVRQCGFCIFILPPVLWILSSDNVEKFCVFFSLHFVGIVLKCSVSERLWSNNDVNTSALFFSLLFCTRKKKKTRETTILWS